MLLTRCSNGGVGDGDEVSVDDFAVAQAAAVGCLNHRLVQTDGASSSSSEESSSAGDSSTTSGASESSCEGADSESDVLAKDMQVQLVLSVRGEHLNVIIKPVERSTENNLQSSMQSTELSDSPSDSADSESIDDSTSEEPGPEGMRELLQELISKSTLTEDAVLARESASHGLAPPEPLVGLELSETDEIKLIGVLESVVEGLHVVQASTDEGPLFSDGSVVCLEDRTPLGRIDDVFGPTDGPRYMFRYSAEQEPPPVLAPGDKIFCVVKYAKTVDERTLHEEGYDPVVVIGPNGIEEDGHLSDGDVQEVSPGKRKMRDAMGVAKPGQGRGVAGLARGQRSRRGADRGRSSGAPRGRQQYGDGRNYQRMESAVSNQSGSSRSSMGHQPSRANGSMDPPSGRNNANVGRNNADFGRKRNNGRSHQRSAQMPHSPGYSGPPHGYMPNMPLQPYAMAPAPAMLPQAMYAFSPHAPPQGYVQHGNNFMPVMPAAPMPQMYGMAPGPPSAYVPYPPQAWGSAPGMPYGMPQVWGPPGPNGMQAAQVPYHQPGSPVQQVNHQPYPGWQNQPYQ